jgi:mono/diheme cytochrome c family protein
VRISSGRSLENCASGSPRIAVRIGRVLCLCAFVMLLAGLQTQVRSHFIAHVTEAQTRAQAPSADAASSGNVQTGRQFFTSEGCDKCHGGEAQGLSRSVRNDAGPRIGPTRLALTVFVRFVRNPPGLMPPYPAQAVSDVQLADVHAFLQSLAPMPQLGGAASGDPQKGQRLFTSDGCFQCHGGEGQGSAQTGGSRIGPPQIPFPVFASYVRSPVGNMPPYSIQALPDSDLADIYAFLHSRPEPAPASSIPLLNQ